MAQNSIYRMTYVQALNDVRFSNVLHFKQTSANVTNDPRKDLADAWEAGAALALASVLSDQWTDRCIQIRDMGIPGQDFWRQLTSNAGSDSAEPLPSEVCAQLKLFTANAGVGNTGRAFFSGIPIDKEEDNCLTEAYMASWSAFLGYLTGEINNGGATFVVGLRKGDGSFDQFENAVIKSALTVQRSRKQPIIC